MKLAMQKRCQGCGSCHIEKPMAGLPGADDLSPHSAHAGADIQLWSLAGGACCRAGGHNRPSGALEQSEQLLGDEARPGCIEVAIALCVLAVDEEALRYDEMKIIL